MSNGEKNHDRRSPSTHSYTPYRERYRLFYGSYRETAHRSKSARSNTREAAEEAADQNE